MKYIPNTKMDTYTGNRIFGEIDNNISILVRNVIYELMIDIIAGTQIHVVMGANNWTTLDTALHDTINKHIAESNSKYGPPGGDTSG